MNLEEEIFEAMLPVVLGEPTDDVVEALEKIINAIKVNGYSLNN